MTAGHIKKKKKKKKHLKITVPPQFDKSRLVLFLSCVPCFHGRLEEALSQSTTAIILKMQSATSRSGINEKLHAGWP